MGKQNDAGKDIVVVSKFGKELTLIVRRSDSKFGALGSAGGVHFQLEQPHTVRYKRDSNLFHRSITLFVDGKQMFRKDIFNPFERIEFPFEIGGIDCEFVVYYYAVALEVKVYVGGQEIFYQ